MLLQLFASTEKILTMLHVCSMRWLHIFSQASTFVHDFEWLTVVRYTSTHIPSESSQKYKFVVFIAYLAVTSLEKVTDDLQN